MTAALSKFNTDQTNALFLILTCWGDHLSNLSHLYTVLFVFVCLLHHQLVAQEPCHPEKRGDPQLEMTYQQRKAARTGQYCFFVGLFFLILNQRTSAVAAAPAIGNCAYNLLFFIIKPVAARVLVLGNTAVL